MIKKKKKKADRKCKYKCRRKKALVKDSCGPPYRRANYCVWIPSHTPVQPAAVMRMVLCDSLEIVEEEKERPEVDKFTGCRCEQVSC